MEKSILIIDDDTKLINLLSDYLKQYEMEVLSATHPSDGMKLLKKHPLNLVVLDVMLPEKNGFEVCKDIRRESDVPIIMLTARGDVTDRVVGLELGADDYLSKPFEPRELLARIQSVLRRGASLTKPERIVAGDLEIDMLKRTVTSAGEPVDLTTTEFEILTLFASHPGQVFNRDQIMDNLRGIEWDAFNRSIDVLVSRLRQKLKDNPKKPRYLKTVWGTGYAFIGETDVESA